MFLEALLGAGGSILSGVLGSNAAEDAAEISAEAIAEAQRISAEQAAQARTDAMGLYTPAMTDYNKMMGMSIDEIQKSGIDVMDILSRGAAGSSDLLGQTGRNVNAAIMGEPIQEYDTSAANRLYDPNAYSQPFAPQERVVPDSPVPWGPPPADPGIPEEPPTTTERRYDPLTGQWVGGEPIEPEPDPTVAPVDQSSLYNWNKQNMYKH